MVGYVYVVQVVGVYCELVIGIVCGLGIVYVVYCVGINNGFGYCVGDCFYVFQCDGCVQCDFKYFYVIVDQGLCYGYGVFKVFDYDYWDYWVMGCKFEWVYGL